MGNRFAGAADLAQRRRRRLARTDHVEDIPLLITSLSTGANSLPQQEARLLRKVVSPRLWKHLSLLAGLPLLWVVLYGAAGVPRPSVMNGFSGILLLLAAQLATIVGWLRARSATDFQGHYRAWKWLAIGLAAGAALILTDSASVLPDVVAYLLRPLTGPLESARKAVVLVPALAWCGFILVRVLPDMNRSVWSQSLLILALLVGIVRFMLVHTPAVTSISADTLSALVLASTYAAFASMLLHCRHVAYICNDAPDGM